MKCPRCGEEMMLGYLNIAASGHAIAVYWDMDKHEFLASGEKLFVFRFTHGNIESYRCSKCQIVVFSYEKRKKAEFQDEFKAAEYGDVEKYLR